MKKITASLLGLFGLVSFASAAQDWTAVATDVTAEITAVMPVALGIMTVILAVTVGARVLKRIGK